MLRVKAMAGENPKASERATETEQPICFSALSYKGKARVLPEPVSARVGALRCVPEFGEKNFHCRRE